MVFDVVHLKKKLECSRLPEKHSSIGTNFPAGAITCIML